MPPSRTIKRVNQVSIPTSGTTWVDPTEDPQGANNTIESLLEEANKQPLPEVSFPENDLVNLPGGLYYNEKLVKTVQVKELTGEDEESLAKVSQALNSFSFLDRLLRCGVKQVGFEDEKETHSLLSQMLIGDREAIILGIRRATYGDGIEVKDFQCPVCGTKSDLEIELDDIPTTTLDDPSDASFNVKLRKGGEALVHLANGEDQLAVFEKADLTQAQRETILLSRCVESITDANGSKRSMAAFPSMSRTMSVPDRHAILKELGERQPGPKYDQVKFTCESCNNENKVAITIGNLFLDFGWI